MIVVFSNSSSIVRRKNICYQFLGVVVHVQSSREREFEEKEIKGIFSVKASSFRTIHVSHKTTRKPLRVIILDLSGYILALKNIGPAMEHSDLLSLVVGPLN